MKENKQLIKTADAGHEKEISCRVKRQLSVYIHIPFCVKKCLYCDFLSMVSNQEMRNQYVNALISEIEEEARLYQDYQVVTIFFGGGTPSLLEGSMIHRILCKLKEHYDVWEKVEVTMEMNPGTVSKENLQSYFESGVNRISIGLQSANNQELKKLGRIHTYEEFLESYRWVREAGFTNVNVDIISSLPEQTEADYRETLLKVTTLTPPPEHISAYSLILEEGTPFFELYKDMEEEQDRILYELTEAILGDKGYQRYEISNYAKDGYECKHNVVYWTGKDYVGFGIGAASYVNNRRWTSSGDISKYLKFYNKDDQKGTNKQSKEELKENDQVLTVKEQMEEFMFLGLRLISGVSKQEFFLKFGVSMDEIYGDILLKKEREGLLINQPQVILTKKGIDLSNYVFTDFLF